MKVAMAKKSNPIKIFKALSDETRLRILWLLDKHELSVNDIVEILNSSQSRVSRHLTVLRDARFLECRREGTWAYYRKAPDENLSEEHAEIWKLVHKWAEGREEPQRDQKRLQETLQKKRQRSHRFYGKHARRWDEIRATLCSETVTHQAFEALIPPDLLVADIGTGTGHLLIPLARIVKKVIGVDHSKEMLNLARQNAYNEGLNNVELRAGEIDDLPLKHNEVDAVIAGLVLHHAPEPQTAIEEMARVVKPGGTVVLIDLQQHQEEWMRDELADIWLGFNKEKLMGWFENVGLIPLRWIEGTPPSPEKRKEIEPSLIKNFVFYGRKPS